MMNMMLMIGNMMGQMRMMNMMPIMGNMMSMMHGSHESEEHASESTGLTLQMQGEMLKAMGDIMLKYGKLLAEESTLKE